MVAAALLYVVLATTRYTATATIAAITAMDTSPVSARIPLWGMECVPYPERLKFPFEP